MPTLDPQGEYLARVWKEAVYPLAERLGIRMRLPPVQPRSRLAHEAAKWARTQDHFDEYNAAIFRAFFEGGEDIGSEEVLARLAVDLNLDAVSLRGSLKAREFEASVLADEDEAEALGVRGVPAFVADRRAALSGVQSMPALQALIDQVKIVK